MGALPLATMRSAHSEGFIQDNDCRCAVITTADQMTNSRMETMTQVIIGAFCLLPYGFSAAGITKTESVEPFAYCVRGSGTARKQISNTPHLADISQDDIIHARRRVFVCLSCLRFSKSSGFLTRIQRNTFTNKYVCRPSRNDNAKLENVFEKSRLCRRRCRARRAAVGAGNYFPISTIELNMSCSEMMPTRSAKQMMTKTAIKVLIKPLPQPTI